MKRLTGMGPSQGEEDEGRQGEGEAYQVRRFGVIDRINPAAARLRYTLGRHFFRILGA